LPIAILAYQHFELEKFVVNLW